MYIAGSVTDSPTDNGIDQFYYWLLNIRLVHLV
jgi:hypothetical protein